MLKNVVEALKTYDWGDDPSVLQPIDEAVVSSHGDSAARIQLESTLAGLLGDGTTYDATDYICRKLMVIGTAASVPALTALLTDDKLSHMARYALERIPDAAAGNALRDALPKLSGVLKIGVLSSLGVRQDAASVPVAARLLGDSDGEVARAAALALGAIRSPEAAQALANSKPHETAQPAVTDALLACAENLLACGQKGEALAVYKVLSRAGQPKLVRLAATRGVLACAGN
jgi:hypothetical protein